MRQIQTTERSADRSTIAERKKHLDDKIRRSMGYPSPLELFKQFGKNDSEDRSSNKIQLEELVRLKRLDLDSKYLDATLDFIKIRGGCDHGLSLAKFMQE